MRTRPLGRTGLIVSEFALGAMTFGKEADEPAAHMLLDRFTEAGGNFVDAADVYQAGAAEEIIGSWLDHRPGAPARLFLATKRRFSLVPDPNQAGLTPRWILRAWHASR